MKIQALYYFLSRQVGLTTLLVDRARHKCTSAHSAERETKFFVIAREYIVYRVYLYCLDLNGVNISTMNRKQRNKESLRFQLVEETRAIFIHVGFLTRKVHRTHIDLAPFKGCVHETNQIFMSHMKRIPRSPPANPLRVVVHCIRLPFTSCVFNFNRWQLVLHSNMPAARMRKLITTVQRFYIPC